MTFEERKLQNEKIRDLSYYFLIAVVSLVSVVFLPLLSSSLNGELEIPNTPMEWAIWITSKVAICIVNMLIFYAFVQQAKVNVRKDQNYCKANEIMQKIKERKDLLPRSPNKYNTSQWLSKGTSLLISSLISTVVLTEAILRFDLAQFLAYLFTLFMGIVFGYLTMRKNEDYWTSEYLAYAEYVLKCQNKPEICSRTDLKNKNDKLQGETNDNN